MKSPGVLLVTVLAIAVGASCGPRPSATQPRGEAGAFIASAMRQHFGLARAERISPLAASRATSYAAIALYEGVAAGSPRLRTLVGQLNGLDSLPAPPVDGRIDPVTAAVVAHATVTRAMYADAGGATRAAIDRAEERQVEERARAGIPTAVIDRSASYGHELGMAVVRFAAEDGFQRTRGAPFELPVGNGAWQPTASPEEFTTQMLSGAAELVYLDNPSASLSAGTAGDRAMVVNQPKLTDRPRMEAVHPSRALEPHWGEHRTLALRDGDECAPPPPPPYSTAASSAFQAEVRAVHEASLALTAEQRAVAQFWADNPGQTGTPAGHWLAIMAHLIDRDRLDAEAAAELFVVGAVAISDAFIGCWRVKYETMVLRPVTAIRATLDPEWQTLVSTPPFPEYPSGHSVQSAAAAEVLTALLGDAPFVDSTQVALGHPPRTFPSFRAAAAEAAVSRLYGGIHYPMAVDRGVEQGTCIGRKVLERVRTRRE